MSAQTSSVLIVDDSAIVRRVLELALKKCVEFGPLWTAPSAAEGLKLASRHQPDLVLMDIRMPGMDGLEAIHRMRQQSTAQVVLITGASNLELAHYQIRALAAGALDVLSKPDNLLQDEGFLARLRALSQAIRRRPRAVSAPTAASSGAPGMSLRATASRSEGGRGVPQGAPRVVGVVSSTGGPQTLKQVLSPLPSDFPACILLTQHISPGFEAAFVQWLGAITPLSVCEASEGMLLLPGWILVAPPDAHLVVHRGRVQLDTQTPPFAGHRPAGNPMLASLAREFGSHAWGIVLTGMGTDGAQGLAQLRQAGGHTLAQDTASSIVDGMPRASRDLGAVDVVLSSDQIGPYLRNHIPSSPGEKSHAQDRRCG